MATQTVLQLEFLTDQNKKVRINVPNPKQPVDATAVTNTLDLIVTKGIFAFPQGLIVKQAGANLVQTDTNPVA